MKNYKTILIIAILCVSLFLIGCGKSDKVIDVEQRISNLSEVTIDSYFEIKEIRNLYNSLSDKEKGQVENISVLNDAEKTVLEAYKPYIECIDYLRNTLKDISSMRLFGDIYYLKANSNPGFMLCVTYDAKNGYGAYNGRKNTEIYNPITDAIFAVDEDSSNYVGLRETIDGENSNNFINIIKAQGGDFFVISGEAISEIMDIEHY